MGASQSMMRATYPPWEFMLQVDAVNYSLSEQLAVRRALGAPLINLSSGVSYYPAPGLLLQEFVRAIDYPSFHLDYHGPEGHVMSRRAIWSYEQLLSRNRVALSDEHVLITHGASMAIHLLSLYFAEIYPGAEILVPVPTFPLAGASMAFAGLAVREVVHAGSGRFLPTLAELQAAQSTRTRLLFLNIFNNPTGETYAEPELVEIIRWARDSDLLLLVDKVSIDLVPGRPAPNVLDIAYEQSYLDGVLIVSSLSKDRSLPGLRAGWVIAPPGVIAALSRYHGLISVCPATPSAALLFVDMLCRTMLAVASRSGGTSDWLSIAELFVEHGLSIAPLAPDIADYLKPYREAAHLETLYAQFAAWHANLMDLLQHNWRLLTGEFGAAFPAGTAWSGGFNTFVHVPLLDRVDPYVFTVRLFRERGLQILPGPSFAGTAADWQARHEFWTRVSFAMEPAKLKHGLAGLLSFIEEY